MATLSLYVNNEVFKKLENAIDALDSYNITLDLEYNTPDGDGYRDVTISSDCTYALYRLGIEMGKLSTTI